MSRWLSVVIRIATLVPIVVQGSACTTVTYPGPRLPADQVAVVEGREVAIDAIDGLEVRGRGTTFEVRPGNHRLLVRLTETTRIPGAAIAVTRFRYSEATPLCLSAQAKHVYIVENKAGALWNPIIADGSSEVHVPPGGPIGDDRRSDFPCGGPLVEESLASGLQKVSGCGVENVYGYDLDRGQWRSVIESAMFDLNCPGAQLAVHHLGGNQVAVVGCGLQAEYVADVRCAKGLCVFNGWIPTGYGR
jgi:hypothetical protein